MGVLVPALIGTMKDLSSLAAIRRDEETWEVLAREESGGTEASASLCSWKKKERKACLLFVIRTCNSDRKISLYFQIILTTEGPD